MANKNVIVGGGPAGINAIETIRQIDGKGSSITLISDEPAYSRMVLPYFIAGEINEKHVYTGGDEYFDKLGVETMFGKRVSSIDSKSNQVSLDDGASVEYDKLLIATGSSAQMLDIPGADGDGVYNLWTLNDARKALSAGGEVADVVMIGAGFIGFIVLNAMGKLHWNLSVVELEDQILPRMLDNNSAQMVQKWLEKKGVKVFTGTSVTNIDTTSSGKKNVKLASGQDLTADLVIMATGITANIDLVKGSGIETNQGILLNQKMQTNIPDIYAAGDMAEGPDLSTGKKAVHAIQPTAIDHGRVAGANMAGQETAYAGSLLMNVLNVLGLHCASFGIWQGEDHDVTEIANPSRPILRKLVWDDDRIVGSIFIGPADDVGMLNDVGMVKGMIQTKANLGDWKAYIEKNPFDIRKPYVASKTASKVLGSTILGKPSAQRAYRYSDAKPGVAHAVLTGTRPS